MPHMEGDHEVHGLRFWDGDPTVRLLEADDDLGAMLLERCQPGTALRAMPEPEQDLVISRLLRRLWRLPPAPHPFRPLSMLMEYRSEERWLVIDPKPFVGDPAYDVTQHLFNCDVRLHSDPDGMIRRMADLLGIGHERIRLWAFARAAAEPRDDWSNEGWIQIARATTP
jgi:streptomycin 6-kinase